MMRQVGIIGVGAHPTGRFMEKPLKAIAYPAIWRALNDAGVEPADLQAAYVGNSLGGLLTGQEGVRGQVVLQYSGITGVPVVNVENACARGGCREDERRRFSPHYRRAGRGVGARAV